jgi:hypothetical protein
VYLLSSVAQLNNYLCFSLLLLVYFSSSLEHLVLSIPQSAVMHSKNVGFICFKITPLLTERFSLFYTPWMEHIYSIYCFFEMQFVKEIYAVYVDWHNCSFYCNIVIYRKNILYTIVHNSGWIRMLFFSNQTSLCVSYLHDSLSLCLSCGTAASLPFRWPLFFFQLGISLLQCLSISFPPIQ